MHKIGFSLQTSYSLPIPEVLRILRHLGVHAISPVWQRDGDLDSVVNTAARCGLTLQSLHGPLRGLPAMWSRDRSCSSAILQDFLDSADACAAFGIPILVVHSWTGLEYTFQQETLFFDNFDTLVNHACKRGVQIAFENLEGPEYLDALMTRYRDCPTVGLCWDSGHERCYTPSWDFLEAYGDRLLMTHLNDNLGITDPNGILRGTDDLHLLPYDGTTDWNRCISRLKAARPQEILNFECKIRPKGDRCTHDLYSKLPLEQYLTEAHRRAASAAAAYFK